MTNEDKASGHPRRAAEPAVEERGAQGSGQPTAVVKKPQPSLPPILKYGTGAVATMGACIFSNPLEVIKTRMQLQGEMKSYGTYTKSYRNVFHAGYLIFKNEGAVSGAVSSCFGSPFYLVKTQQQAQCATQAAVGYQHHHKSGLDAFRGILHESGVKGLWRGVTGSIPRLIVGSSVQLSTYSQSREVLQKYTPMEEGVLLHFSASMLAGMFVAVAMNPFDVVATRLYNQPVDPKTKKGLYYRSVGDCLVKIFRTEGLRGLYKGVMPLYLRLGPHTVLTFVFWEQLRKPFEQHQVQL
ncbi:hypothetical protein PTSG_04820 [Salpingoeca rosetta]|uniref:Uncharacterized protein n=1 Tax=Salpingoeca rosetta (strain ATCC 50818 / BSB-021) TaxID=946362 RepID=F2U9S9_SALR5|nr:uncharacterized protein PTSG_04820 [Salpingoeca rosetta]EGD73106.1 hypothetical protein PTSG_04820 [Salpingoeca rosetta]|eukprot:XP_004994137.1 hypothetical protein PTSG_04820 [Salpingoeca rosetta]